MAYRDRESRVAAGLGCLAGLIVLVFALPNLIFGPIRDPLAHILFWWGAILVGPFATAWIMGRMLVLLRRRR